MSDRKLTILGVAAAVMLVWAVVQSNLMNRQSRPKYAGPATLIQGLDMSKVFGIELLAKKPILLSQHFEFFHYSSHILGTG